MSVGESMPVDPVDESLAVAASSSECARSLGGERPWNAKLASSACWLGVGDLKKEGPHEDDDVNRSGHERTGEGGKRGVGDGNAARA